MPEYCKGCKYSKLTDSKIHTRWFCAKFFDFERENLDEICSGDFKE